MRHGKGDEKALRRAYLVVLIFPLLAVVRMWAEGGPTDLFGRMVYPMVVVTHGGMLLGFVTRRLSLPAVGRGTFISITAILVGRVATWEADPLSRPDDLGLVVVALAWIGVVYALAFVAFGTRQGALTSVVGYVIVYLWAVLSASGGMMAGRDTRQVAGMAGAHAAFIAVVWVLARNIEQLAVARARVDLLALEATTDSLTGIANRRRLDDELQRLVARSRRHGEPLSAVLVDLDDFKNINDGFGHEVGDQVLVATVAKMLATTRDDDLLGRWGGEEFLLLAAHTDREAALGLAERCRSAIAQMLVGDEEVTVTASFGVATLRPHDDARALMRRADLALYTAKSDGRNRVVTAPSATGPMAVTLTR
jgi:diguanylate cyclase (GGDEF)-like protein